MEPKLFNLKQSRKKIRVQLMASAFGTAIFLYIMEQLREHNPAESGHVYLIMIVGVLLQVVNIGRLICALISINREVNQWKF